MIQNQTENSSSEILSAVSALQNATEEIRQWREATVNATNTTTSSQIELTLNSSVLDDAFSRMADKQENAMKGALFPIKEVFIAQTAAMQDLPDAMRNNTAAMNQFQLTAIEDYRKLAQKQADTEKEIIRQEGEINQLANERVYLAFITTGFGIFLGAVLYPFLSRYKHMIWNKLITYLPRNM